VELHEILGRYGALAAKVDVFFDRVLDAHRAEMQCGSGCSDCCSVRLTVTLVEAATIAAALAEMAEEARGTIAARAVASGPERCAALDADHRCSIYAARPLVCRSHGAPIRRRDPDRSLPVVDACPRNFTGGFADVPEADGFDQETISTVLAALDAALADAVGTERGIRLDLGDLLADPEQYFELE